MYKLNYDNKTGMASTVTKLSTSETFSLNHDNSDFKQFLAWNTQQDVPLDLEALNMDLPNEATVSFNQILRDGLLAESDWTQINDVPLTLEKKLEWSIYRQLLRDIPQDYGWENPTWPTKPVN